jgi:hypothetical protein
LYAATKSLLMLGTEAWPARYMERKRMAGVELLCAESQI